MAGKASPITPAVLKWSLAQDGRALEDVAIAAKFDPVDLRAWAAGDAQPTVGQVTKLGEVLQRPRAFFFLPEPPEGGALPSGFRHPPGGGSHTVSSKVLVEVRRAKRLQRALASLLEPDKVVNLPYARLEESPTDRAGDVRRWLGVMNQQRWRDDRASLNWWREMLEAKGVLVFMLQLGREEVRGFADWDPRVPLIVANTSDVNPAARTYTVGHELAHLVLREATACIEPEERRLVVDSRTERWCEAFAAALIMPAPEVHGLMRERRIGKGQADIDEVRDMMSRFRASARAAAVRLRDLGYADETLYPRVLAVFKRSPRREGQTPRSPRRHIARVRQYGGHTVETLMAGLPARDALSVLRMNVEDARRLADEVPGVVTI